MNFSIAQTMRRLCAPDHELSCSWVLWCRLVAALRQHGRNYGSESGAFLLGRSIDSRARVLDFVLYDRLDPHSLDTGIVRFDGRYFGALWEFCKQRNCSVVADIHTHPGGSQQSESDRANPMITRRGHLALIVPRFAAPPVRRSEIGIYRYEGDKRWYSISPSKRHRFFHIGF